MTVFCNKSEDLRAMVLCFVEAWRRGGLKFSAGKNKILVLNGEEELECEVWMNQAQMEQNAVGR